MKLDYPVIAVGGYSRTGKDSLAELLHKLLKQELNEFTHTRKFADSVKMELRERCMEEYGIDSFTEYSDEKEIIRPLMTELGCGRREENPDYWINTLMDNINITHGTVVVCDVRFQNELEYLRNNYGSIVVLLNREGFGARNKEEEEFTMPLYDLANGTNIFIYEWPNSHLGSINTMHNDDWDIFVESFQPILKAIKEYILNFERKPSVSRKYRKNQLVS